MSLNYENSINTSNVPNLKDNSNVSNLSVNNKSQVKQQKSKNSTFNFKRILNAFVVVVVFLFGSLAKPQ
jgi:hypothetical protein